MRRFVAQFCAAIFLSIPTALVSISIVWPSYTIKLLESEDSPSGFKLTKLESNLVVSIPYLGSLVMTLVAGWCAEAVGRKNTHTLCGLLFIVSWSLITTAKSSTTLVIGRLVAGMSGGLTLVNVIVFITEITELKLRSSAITLLSFTYNIGALVSYLLGWFCSYQVVCYVNVTTAVAYVLLVACFKESPVYLMKNGREKEALNALKFYRGAFGIHVTEDIIIELADMKKQSHSHSHIIDSDKDLKKSNTATENEKLCRQQDAENQSTVSEETKNPWMLLLTVDYNRRALFTLMLLMGLCVSLGMIAVQAYAGSIFQSAVPSLSADLCCVLLAVVLILSCGFTMLVTDLVSRRLLMLSTCITATICLSVLGSMLRWSWGPVWVSPLAILVYSFCFHLGCINIVFVQLGECFDPQVNSAASSIVVCVMFLTNFLVLFTYAPALDILGIDGIFFAFSVIGLITTIVSALFLKETRRVSIEKIQQMNSMGYLYRKMD